VKNKNNTNNYVNINKNLIPNNISCSNTKIKKVAVGLSGGVDSSVSALLLLQKGYDVTGIYMQCWDTNFDGCTSDEDKKYAVETATKLGIKIIFLDYINEYKEKVISYFYNEYKNGRTPNPDIMCNKEIKFGLFYDWAIKNGYDYVATGHYAQIEQQNNEYYLLKGVDITKDQSYFLYNLNQDQLSKILFPVGGMLKSQIREIAKNAKLPSATKPDSMGICFIGEVNIKDFLNKQLPIKQGPVVLQDNTQIGQHFGAWFYTVGQRKGFSINKYQGTPLYVIKKDVDKNILVVGTKDKLYFDNFEIEPAYFIKKSKINNFSCTVRVRHLGILYKAKVNNLKVTLNKKIFGIASGQSAVFYKNNRVIGGAIIK